MQLQQYTSTKVFEEEAIKATNVHSGQKRAYGDSFYEYEIESKRPADEVEAFCREILHKAIPHSEWLEDYRNGPSSMEKAFRPHYKFSKIGDGKYFYQVIRLYAD